jgi:hypothetical protein
MVSNPTTFSDIQNHWARPFIEPLLRRGVVAGQSGVFRPDNSITRAEYAAIITKAFTKIPKRRQYIPFVDVPANNWAFSAIQTAFETGFLNGFPDNRFLRPDNRISRLEVLLSLVAGLDIASKIRSDLLNSLPQIYEDSVQIPGYARNQVAIATSAEIVSSQLGCVYPSGKLR